MPELLTSAQMRDLEHAAFASGAVDSRDLMERAGQGVVDAVFAHWPDWPDRPGRAMVLCGPGNNGGDGLVVARLLRDRGWQVQVFLLGETHRLPTDARANCARWQTRGAVQPIGAADVQGAPEPDLIVDALFGIGLTRGLGPPLDDLAQRINARRRARVVAIDIPSGVCADSGRALGETIRADLTVTFHSRKPGHVLRTGPAPHSRAVVIADIGLGPTRQQDPREPCCVESAPPVPSVLRKSGARHKFDYGHAVVVSGPAGRTGAARMAARGALRIGAGLVSIAARAEAMPEIAAQVTAIMLMGLKGAGDITAQFEADDRANAFCIGPALGTDAFAVAAIRSVLDLKRATVLDADALTLLAAHPALMERLHTGCVLTPHGGEFARLFPDIAADLAAPPTKGPACSKIDATRMAARRTGCVVLYKGRDTVIAEPGGRCVIHAGDATTAWLATAGSGDVLAGFICGLMARGLSGGQAADTGTCLQGACARAIGPGLIAEDLPEALPAVFGSLAV